MLAVVLHLHANERPSDVIAGSVVVNAFFDVSTGQATIQWDEVLTACLLMGQIFLGRGSRQWMVKPLSCHPFAAY